MLFWCLRNRTKTKDIKLLSHYISEAEQIRKPPRKWSLWNLYTEPDCVRSIRWEQLRITFSLRKENNHRKPEMLEKILSSFQSGPNQGWIRRLHVSRQRPGPWGASGLESRTGPGPCRLLLGFFVAFLLSIEVNVAIVIANRPRSLLLCRKRSLSSAANCYSSYEITYDSSTINCIKVCARAVPHTPLYSFTAYARLVSEKAAPHLVLTA
jgi:hypothetical protein